MIETERQALREKHGKDEGLEPRCPNCDLYQSEQLQAIVDGWEITCGHTEDGQHAQFTEWVYFCQSSDCQDVEYPCDVIKILDAWEDNND